MNTPTSAMLEADIAQIELKTREYTSQLETAQRELEAKRGAIDFANPQTVEAATTAQARFTVITEAKADLERRLVDLGAQHETAVASEDWAAKLARVRELAAQRQAKRDAYSAAKRDAAKQLSAIQGELNRIGGASAQARRDFAELMDEMGEPVLPELEALEAQGVPLLALRAQQNHRYKAAFLGNRERPRHRAGNHGI